MKLDATWLAETLQKTRLEATRLTQSLDKTGLVDIEKIWQGHVARSEPGENSARSHLVRPEPWKSRLGAIWLTK